MNENAPELTETEEIVIVERLVQEFAEMGGLKHYGRRGEIVWRLIEHIPSVLSLAKRTQAAEATLKAGASSLEWHSESARVCRRGWTQAENGRKAAEAERDALQADRDLIQAELERLKIALTEAPKRAA